MFKPILMTSVLAAAVMSVMLVVTPLGAGGNERPFSSSGDHYTFGRDAVIDSPTKGNVQVLGGSAQVNDLIDGDLMVIGGNVVFAGAGRVTGNLIYGGGRVVGGENRIGGRVYPLTTLEGAAASLTRSAVILALLLGWLLVAVILTLTGGREIRFSSVEIRASALYCFAIGLVGFTSFILTAIIFSYLVPYFIGVPLLVALGVFGILTKVYGMVAVFHAIGTLAAGSRTREQLASRKWFRGDLAMVVAGFVILGALRMIPVVGPILWSTASIFGIGVALATMFGRRDPWFLSFSLSRA